ncbi:hypothetical protein [Roseiflexus sp.]|uniref:hypothetical protein n=1 Tax=Roseiflexus sp. TaxID=2562120 RepID=UPI00398A7008
MTSDYSFMLDMPPNERDDLILLLRSAGAQVQEAPTREIDWQTIVAVIGAVGTVAGAASNLIDLANKLNEWRASLRRQGKTPHSRLRRPDQPSLHLATATDEEVLQWLLKTPPTA